MKYHMFVDDIRGPNLDSIFDYWVIVRSSEEAIQFMVDKGCPISISFDHDLGGDDTSMKIVKWMIEKDLDTNHGFIPEGFTFEVHSENPIGSENIRGLLDSYLSKR